MNINELRTLINDKKKELNLMLGSSRDGVTITKTKEMNGTEEILTPECNYMQKTCDMFNLTREIGRLKGTLALANANTLIDFAGLTIQQGIVYISELESALEYLTGAVNCAKPYTRRKDGYSNGALPYYEIVELNFNKEDMDGYIKDVKAEINNIKAAIERANAATQV